MAQEAEVTSTSGLWVFGYGSLCWHPGFDFDKSLTGYIRGFSRKFWQGNTTHRGTESKPGRVATLVEDKEPFAVPDANTHPIAVSSQQTADGGQGVAPHHMPDVNVQTQGSISSHAVTDIGSRYNVGGALTAHGSQAVSQSVNRHGAATQSDGIVWGRAFEVRGEAALPYLDTRECKLGGYHVQITTFYPRQSSPFSSDSESSDSSSAPTCFPAVFYVATPTNRHWLGDAPLTEIASQIVECSGPSGHNVEYLLRLASFMHDSIPEALDDHLYTLEFLVRTRIKEQNLCLKTLMGDAITPATPPRTPPQELEDGVEEEGAAGGEPMLRPDSFQFTSRVPPKKLRCLNI